MIQRKLGGLTNLVKAKNAGAFSAPLDLNLHKTMLDTPVQWVVISKNRVKGKTINCNGLLSYSHRPVTIGKWSSTKKVRFSAFFCNLLNNTPQECRL